MEWGVGHNGKHSELHLGSENQKILWRHISPLKQQQNIKQDGRPNTKILKWLLWLNAFLVTIKTQTKQKA